MQVFGGVGVACLPMGMINTFIHRPKTTITLAQYTKVILVEAIIPAQCVKSICTPVHTKINVNLSYTAHLHSLRPLLNFTKPIDLPQEATQLAKRGKEIKEIVLGLQREERAGTKGSKWKKNFLKIQQVKGDFKEHVVFPCIWTLVSWPSLQFLWCLLPLPLPLSDTALGCFSVHVVYVLQMWFFWKLFWVQWVRFSLMILLTECFGHYAGACILGTRWASANRSFPSRRKGRQSYKHNALTSLILPYGHVMDGVMLFISRSQQ